MKTKIKNLERIERLRKRMHEIAVWRQAAAALEKDKLTSDHAEMIEALGDGLMAYGPAAVAGTRRVRKIERQLAEADVVEKDLARRTLEEGRLAKLADSMLDSARGSWREIVDRRSLEDLIAGSLKPDSGSHKG